MSNIGTLPGSDFSGHRAFGAPMKPPKHVVGFHARPPASFLWYRLWNRARQASANGCSFPDECTAQAGQFLSSRGVEGGETGPAFRGRPRRRRRPDGILGCYPYCTKVKDSMRHLQSFTLRFQDGFGFVQSKRTLDSSFDYSLMCTCIVCICF